MPREGVQSNRARGHQGHLSQGEGCCLRPVSSQLHGFILASAPRRSLGSRLHGVGREELPGHLAQDVPKQQGAWRGTLLSPLGQGLPHTVPSALCDLVCMASLCKCMGTPLCACLGSGLGRSAVGRNSASVCLLAGCAVLPTANRAPQPGPPPGEACRAERPLPILSDAGHPGRRLLTGSSFSPPLTAIPGWRIH